MKFLILTSILVSTVVGVNAQAASVTITGKEAAKFMQSDLLWSGTPAELIDSASGKVLRLHGKYNEKVASCDFLTDGIHSVNIGVQAPVKCSFED